jgi:hypothetical protein
MAQSTKIKDTERSKTPTPWGQVKRLVKIPKCPDFDDDCFDVEDKHTCWLGIPPTYIEDIGKVVYTPTAKGYCPFLRGF